MLGFKRYGLGGLWIAGLGFVVSSCADDSGGAAPVPSAETVESRPGIVQVGDEKGPVLDEADACQQFRSGLTRNLERLECDDVAVLECPVLIQPLGTLACISYSKASVEQCVAAFDAADDCTEVLPGACILTAVPSTLSPGCAVTGDGGATDAGGGSDVTGETDAATGPVVLDGSVTGDTLSHPDAGETLDAAVRQGDASASTEGASAEAGSQASSGELVTTGPGSAALSSDAPSTTGPHSSEATSTADAVTASTSSPLPDAGQ